MHDTIEYTIDPHNKIIRVSDAWDKFYRDNGGTRAPGSFIGEDLFQHITGNEVRMLYTTLIRYARDTQSALTFPFCCNSPEIRRELVMSILPQHDGRVTFFNLVQSVAPWPIPSQKPPPLSTSRPLILCSWCNKVKADVWVELGTAIHLFGLFESTECPAFNHGICPQCQSRIITRLVNTESDKIEAHADAPHKKQSNVSSN